MTARIILLSLGALFTVVLTGSAEDAVMNISHNPSTVSLYGPFAAQIEVKASFEDPYDPAEVELTAHITGPDEREIIMPGFFTGQGDLWEVRYTPLKTGRYSYYINLKRRDISQRSSLYHFEVKSSRNDGFIRRSRNNHYYMVFDSGKPFFGLGHNVCWTSTNRVATFNNYFLKLAKSGSNMTRVWLNNEWTLKIEFDKLGIYDMKDSDELDRLVEAAKENGIYMVLTLDSYSSLMDEKGPWNEQSWEKNVYNKTNGGPCEKPSDFFTNEEAKRLYKKRLRYIISRWSYSPNIFTFEFWNEMDAPKEWVEEMSGYIKSINPHGQFVTTSLGYPWANNFDEQVIWSLKDVDVVERHLYGNMASDIDGYVITTNKALSEKYKKPICIEEFGINWGKNDQESDPDGSGVALHNGIWAAAVSGSFAGTMGWWWDTYMCKHDLYFNYRAIRAFIKDVNWDSDKVYFPNTSPVMKKISSAEPITYSDVVISAKDIWGDTSYGTFTVERSGDIAGGALNHYLHGSFEKNLRIEPVFYVDYPAQGEFIVYVDMVSQHAHLVVTIDGKEVLSKEFLCGAGEGPWKKSFFRKDKKVYQCYYGTTEKIIVPQGKHTIRLSNIGKDWMGIKRIVLAGYKTSDIANARVSGIVVGEDMLFWIQNRSYDWYNVASMKNEPELIEGAYFYLPDAEPGEYEIQWWDTFKGEMISMKRINSSGQKLTIDIPDFSKDIACRIKKITS